MAALAFLVALFLPMLGYASAGWCVCKPGTSEAMLQKTIDYACGAGADCNPIHSTGPCYNPNTVLAHCNYAVNSFYQRKGQANGTCDFAGAASPTASDPSSSSACAYPASASATNTGTVPVSSTTPSTSTGSTSTNPYSTTSPNTGVLGGVGNTLGPVSYDDSSAIGLRAGAGLILAGAAMLLWV